MSLTEQDQPPIPPSRPQVSIRSDGTGRGTYVQVAGTTLTCVESVIWQARADGTASAVVHLSGVGVELIGDLSLDEEGLLLLDLATEQTLRTARPVPRETSTVPGDT